jgi:DNA-binding transcriptional LysR family regulator
MELRQLRYFVSVAEERHFGRAAERLHIAQPGLSQQIKALERSLGADLFDRESRPVALTEAGERFLPHARAIVEAASRAVEATRAAPAQPGPILKVGITAIGHYPEFARLVEVFTDREPHVDVRILPSMPNAMVDSLIRRTLDLGAAHQPLEWPEDMAPPRYLRLGHQEVLIVLPEGHRLASQARLKREDLLEEPVIATPRDVTPKFSEHVSRVLFGVYPHPRAVEVPDAVDRDTRFRLVAEGKGLAGMAVPANSELPPDRGRVAFRRVADPPALIEYGLMWLDVNACPATRSFIQVARALSDVDAA